MSTSTNPSEPPEPLEPLVRAAERVDDLVAPADEIGNEVLVDNRLFVRLAGPMFAAFSLCLVPWTIYIAIDLPSRQLSPNYDIAWAGFDVMLFAALAASAYFALRRSHYLALSTSAAGTMLVIDAWFDVLTSQAGEDRLMAIVFAVIVELPLSALCWWLSRQTEEFVDRRLALLLHRGVPGALRREQPRERHSTR